MEFGELRALMAVVAERSFSRAAIRLSRTQPAISQAIRRLETQVGMRLLDRACKSGELTDAGRVLLDYATRIVGLEEEAQAALSELKNLRRGQVRIAADETTAPVLLPVIDAYRAQHAQVVVDVRPLPERQIFIDLAQGAIDCGIVTVPPDDGACSFVIGVDSLVVLAAPAHSLGSVRSIDGARLASECFVVSAEPGAERDAIVRTLERNGLAQAIGLVLPGVDAVKRTVAQGLGLALLRRSCVESDISAGRLVILDVPALTSRSELHLVYAPRSEASRAAGAFIGLARSLAGWPHQDRAFGSRPAIARATLGGGDRHSRQESRRRPLGADARRLRHERAPARRAPSLSAIHR